MKEPRIEHALSLRLAGLKRNISLAKNETFLLWRSFMPLIKEIKARAGTELYSVEIYPTDYFMHFSPEREFEKWAAAPVTDTFQPNELLQLLEIPGGLYAVFLYRGMSSEAHTAYQYIFGEWIPNSDYEADNRPHFAVMGDKYRNDHPESEEELWIPIRKSGHS
ncbi:GyrI-like domain-containing protein [Flavobacteriaceae bacterium D16]|nr:GyrI-like domain-containing protein [Flavobacteriaceae bacterium D16]